MTKLSPSHERILDYLQDGEWHCMTTTQFYMKDDRKRISELVELGYNIEGRRCDKRCGIKHSSNVFMRRLVSAPRVEIKPKKVELRYDPLNDRMVRV